MPKGYTTDSRRSDVTFRNVTKRILHAAALALLIGACSNGTVTTTTTLETPTISALPTTTTTNPPLVDGGLTPIDPATLIPLQGGEPILVANWFSGVVSPGGSFSAIQSLMTDSETLRMSLVEVEANAVLANVEIPHGFWGDPVVTDDGVVYWLSGEQGLTIFRLGPGDNQAEALYTDFPPNFTGVDLNILLDGRIGVFGTQEVEHAAGMANLILIAADASTHVEIPLENVIAGYSNDPDPDATIQIFEFAGNAPVWDNKADRFFLVEAARDVVTEVDLTTNEVVEHPFSSPVAFLNQLWTFITPVARAKGPVSGVERDAILSPDGQSLFVATVVTETDVEDTSWETTSSPKDLIVLDVDTWDVSNLDIAVDTLEASPDGIHLLAHGAEVTEGTTAGFEVQPSPVYVIDMSVPEVLLGFQTSDESAAEIQFSPDGELVYISTWSQDTVTIDIVDLGLLQLTGAVSFRELSLVGQAGYMAFHLG